MALCGSCINVLRDGHTQKIHSTCRSFLAAVDERCYICQGLFSQVPEEWKQKIRRQAEISEPPASKQRKQDGRETWLTWYSRDSASTRLGSIRLDLLSLDEEAYWHWLPMLGELGQHVYPVAAEPLPWTITSSSTRSEETFAKLKVWLSRCEKTHNKCRLRRNEADVGWHPTRLIEISLAPEVSENANHLECRIVEPQLEDMPRNLRYITLSHRWPQDQQGFQKLTEDKLPLWKASLPVETLCQTFRDTLFVAHKFGVSYVWIDSLCIIQDHHLDWEKESPMMQKVYSNAEFNICASKNDQNDGLFSTRNPSGPQPMQIELPRLSKINNDKFTDSGHYLICNERPETIWDARLNDSPLVSRGWVFQEQLLSRVNLHFGDHEVLFDCREMRASESLGADIDYEVSWRLPMPFLKEYLPFPAVMERDSASAAAANGSGDDCSERRQDNADNYVLWHYLLSRYTTRQLTKPEDRLVALSGVVQYFKGIFWHGDYVAGLWRSRLATEMLWQLKEDTLREDWEKQKTTRHHMTFSWASILGEVWNASEVRQGTTGMTHLADVDVIKYRAGTEGSDVTGGEEQLFTDIYSFTAAPMIEIRLTGFLIPMSIQRAEVSTWWDGGPATNERLWADSDLSLYAMGRDRPLKGQIRLDFEITSLQLTALNNSGRLFLMPLVAFGSTSTCLLLLERVETYNEKDMGRFRRIGVQDALGDGYSRLQNRDFVSSDEYFSDLPCWRYDSISHQHTIFVI